MDWKSYNDWLHTHKQKAYALKMYRYSERYRDLAFTNQLVTMKQTRQRIEILKAIGNLTRYLDIQYDTDLHMQFIAWLKRKEIKWSMASLMNNYQFAKRISVEDVIEALKQLRERYKIFGLFVLTTGLRTGEALNAFNNHSKLCNDGIMELFWDRRTKKANAVYCHPLVHDKIKFTASRKAYLYINKKKLGFDLRYLRKINYTVNVSKVDGLLAEFMQGRSGNVSQRHYYLPSMEEHRNKWLNVWSTIVSPVFQ